jgi:ABC-2 type transport system permease protein
MFILYMAILLYAVNVMRSVVLEKTSRVVEIVVSAAKPRELMLGKIIGVGGVGVFQLVIWAAIALVLFRYRGELLGLFGVPGAAGFELPPLTPGDIAVVLAYFLGGFFFYASLYAAIGAMVNSDQEAQQAQTPVVILLVIPVVCVQLVAGDPRGAAAEVLTLVPFSSPILMPMRWVLGGARATDLALSLALLLAATAVVVWLAARIYRVGILMYGKRPTLRELGRWIRYP